MHKLHQLRATFNFKKIVVQQGYKLIGSNTPYYAQIGTVHRKSSSVWVAKRFLVSAYGHGLLLTHSYIY